MNLPSILSQLDAEAARLDAEAERKGEPFYRCELGGRATGITTATSAIRAFLGSKEEK